MQVEEILFDVDKGWKVPSRVQRMIGDWEADEKSEEVESKEFEFQHF